ncbi:AAA family ATPase [Haloarchaeobius amylolyticus]|uniref:AAA family ATPase n=1 Tax=Haloarchaeobius amylolyticus TaxID=1198296 RepID=UPI00226EA3C3|nr:MoxR family ATPase [Haloarchaeobius amylolyticus]
MPPADALPIDEAARLCTDVIDRVNEAVIGERDFFETVLTGALARGHVLLEDVPGTGKTLTAIVLAQALGLDFSRVQFTPDLLPSDITGSHVYDEHAREFEFQAGPIFSNVVLADEINRAPPKTQAALLEAMDEKQVTVDGTTHQLPGPFFVIATQNPVEQEGTFELPEAQRDRFVVKTSMGYPDRAGELELIDRRSNRHTQMPSVGAALTPDQVRRLQETPETVTMHRQVREYVVDLARATREDERVEVGVSPRGIQRFYEASRAHAVVAGRDYVAPEDVKFVARAVMQHRIVLTPQANIQNATTEDVVSSVLNRIEVPAVSP